MYFKLDKEYTNDTLDYYNFNEPFERALFNAKMLVERANKLSYESSDSYIYSEKDIITVSSNGVKGKFSIDSSDKNIEIFSDTSLKFDNFFKKNSNPEGFTIAHSLSIEEIAVVLRDNGFIVRDRLFYEPVLSSEYPGSDMVSYNTMAEKCFLKTEEIILSELRNVNSTVRDESLVNVIEAKTLFLHKTEPIDNIMISSFDVSSLSGVNSVIDSIVFSEDAEYSDEDGNISVGKAKDISYQRTATTVQSPTIESPGKKAPINKKSLVQIMNNFVSNVEKKFNSLSIEREATSSLDLSRNDIITKEESEAVIDTFFKSMLSPKISSIEEYEELVSSVCEVKDNDYIEKDFIIDGGNVYLDFDYENMHSVFNEVALTTILFDKLGQVTPDTVKTARASEYFRDVDSIQSFMIISNLLGYSFNINTDTLAQVFTVIRKVAEDICNLNILPLLDTPELVTPPIINNTAIFLDPTLDTFKIDFIPPRISLPFFYVPPSFLIFISPEFTSMAVGNEIRMFNLVPPLYLEELNALVMRGPDSLLLEPQGRPTFTKPEKAASYTELEINLYSSNEQLQKTGTFYDGTDCENRILGDIKRIVNMIDANCILERVYDSIEGQDFYLVNSEKESNVITPTLAAVKIVSDVMCALSNKISIPMNISMEGIVNKKQEPIASSGTDLETRKCISSYFSPSLNTDEVVATIDKVEIFSGKTRLGTSDFQYSELIDDNFTIPMVNKWTATDSTNYINMIDDAAEELSTFIENYFEKLSNDNAISDTIMNEFSVKTKSEIISSPKGEGDSVMLDYVDFKNVHTNTSSGINGSADGLHKSSEEYNKDTITLLYGYDIAIFISGPENVSFPVGQDTIIPVIPSGDVKYSFYYPLRQGNTVLESTPSVSLTESVYLAALVKEPMIIIVSTEGSSTVEVFTYKTSISTVTRDESYNVQSSYDLYKNVESTYLVVDPDEGERRIIRMEGIASASVLKMSSVSCKSSLVPLLSLSVDSNFFVGGFDTGLNGLNGMNVPYNDGTINGDTSIDPTATRPEGVGCPVAPEPDPSLPPVVPLPPLTSSGIELDVFENISSIRHLKSDTPASWNEPGDIPANISYNLHMKVNSAMIGLNSRGETVIARKSFPLDIPISLGVIDGNVDDNGDVLAQFFPPDSIPVGNPTAYIPGMCNCLYAGEQNGYTMFYTQLDKVLSAHKHDVTMDGVEYSSLGADILPMYERDDGNNLVPVEKSPIIVLSEKDDETALNATVVGGLGISGYQFSTKHEGSDPTWPIITTTAGYNEVVLVSGQKIVASSSNPMPRIMEDIEDFPANNDFYAMKLAGNAIIHYVKVTKPPIGGAGNVKVICDTVGSPLDPNADAPDLGLNSDLTAEPEYDIADVHNPNSWENYITT